MLLYIIYNTLCGATLLNNNNNLKKQHPRQQQVYEEVSLGLNTKVQWLVSPIDAGCRV